MSRGIVFFVFIFNLAIQPSICFSEAGLQSEKMNMTGAESGLGISKDYTSITQNQYIAGGVLGALPGFGIGHAIQGRWFEKGWIFTGIQLGAPLVGVGLLSLEYGFFTAQVRRYDNRTPLSVFNPLYVGLALAFFAAKTWEIIDVWSLPSHYKIVQEPKLSISPLYSYSPQSSSYGLSLSYKW